MTITANNVKRAKAFMLNLVLPGTGQLFLKQWATGGVLCAIFVLSFLSFLIFFGIGMHRYFTIATGEILKGNNLEQLGRAYNLTAIGFSVAMAFLDFLISVALLWSGKQTELPKGKPRPLGRG
jgi:Na+-transporting methylmalonyl-CoA/oxaloacetate decarboxylase gamma subunit